MIAPDVCLHTPHEIPKQSRHCSPARWAGGCYRLAVWLRRPCSLIRTLLDWCFQTCGCLAFGHVTQAVISIGRTRVTISTFPHSQLNTVLFWGCRVAGKNNGVIRGSVVVIVHKNDIKSVQPRRTVKYINLNLNGQCACGF